VQEIEIVDNKGKNGDTFIETKKVSLQSSKDSINTNSFSGKNSIKIDSLSPQELIMLRKKIDKKIEKYKANIQSQPSTDTVHKNSFKGSSNKIDSNA
jgi:hypothetical protein